MPLSGSRRDIKTARAAHLMHLEESRFALYREIGCFLKGGDSSDEGANPRRKMP
jgi:hypothetical protein